MTLPPERENAPVRQLVAGLDVSPFDPQFRPLLCGLMASDDETERNRKLGWILEFASDLRDPILAYMLWQSEPTVRDTAIATIRARFTTVPELLWRAAVIPRALRDIWPKGLSPPRNSPAKPERIPSPLCSACHVSIPDGTGHVTLFLGLDSGRVPQTALVLMHVAQGFLDAELLPFTTIEHRDRALADMRRDLDLTEVRPSAVHALLGDLFLLAAEQERPPPPKIVDLVPLLWRRDVMRILDGRQPSALRYAKPSQADDSAAWTRKLPLLDSWASGSALAMPVDGPASNRLEHAYFRLEQERPLWLANLRWTAVILSHCATKEKDLSQRFVYLAACVQAGTPLRDIPLFRQIALRTVLAAGRAGMDLK